MTKTILTALYMLSIVSTAQAGSRDSACALEVVDGSLEIKPFFVLNKNTPKYSVGPFQFELTYDEIAPSFISIRDRKNGFLTSFRTEIRNNTNWDRSSKTPVNIEMMRLEADGQFIRIDVSCAVLAQK